MRGGRVAPFRKSKLSGGKAELEQPAECVDELTRCIESLFCVVFSYPVLVLISFNLVYISFLFLLNIFYIPHIFKTLFYQQ